MGLTTVQRYCAACDKLRSETSPGSAASEGAQNMTLFVALAHKMKRNNTLNKVHVAATELPKLLSEYKYYVWRGNRGSKVN